MKEESTTKKTSEHNRNFRFEKNPFGFDMYGKGSITLKPGVTVLIGCNGSGKTTLMETIKRRLKKDQIPSMSLNNLAEGGMGSIDSMLFYHQADLAANMVSASEGEGLRITMGRFFRNIDNFVRTGRDGAHPMDELDLYAVLNQSDAEYQKQKENLHEKLGECQERWLFFDACDSGASIDVVREFKDVFNLIMTPEGMHGKDVYIIVSANSFEMARGERCYDVSIGKFCTFDSYNEYEKVILASREKKDKRVYNDDED